MNAKIEAKLDTASGDITVSIFDLFEWLDDGSRNELSETMAWSSPIADELIRSCLDDYSGECYAPEITNIRTSILTSDKAPKMIREWASEMLHRVKQAKEGERRYDRAYYDLYHAVNDYFDYKVPESMRNVKLEKYKVTRATSEEVDEEMSKINL